MSGKIIIGVDIRDLKIAKTGQKTSLEGFCNEFKLKDKAEIEFYFFDSFLPPYTGKNKFFIILEHIRFQIWKQIILPLKAWHKKCDIVFCNDYFVPYFHLKFKTIPVFHDAFFFENPQNYNKIWLKIFKNIALPAARRSSFIIVPTDYARERVHIYTGIPKERLITIYEGSKHILKDIKETTPPQWSKDLNGNKYILHVGVLERRKNLPSLINAFKRLVDAGFDDIKLVLVGEGNGKMHSDDTIQVRNAIIANNLGNRVALLGYLPDDELKFAYANAHLYVFPSVNEGFGIPILEAFQFGLPVLVANNTCLPEVGGDAVLTFNPFIETEIFEKMKMVLENEPLRQKLKNDGFKRGLEFSWKKASDNTIAVFKRSVSNNKPSF
jgi:glycosyltransferase involved in cell wall biosynthesis